MSACLISAHDIIDFDEVNRKRLVAGIEHDERSSQLIRDCCYLCLTQIRSKQDDAVASFFLNDGFNFLDIMLRLYRRKHERITVAPASFLDVLNQLAKKGLLIILFKHDAGISECQKE
ncbi:hypothetical protein D3C77_327960 [compost metagenome]